MFHLPQQRGIGQAGKHIPSGGTGHRVPAESGAMGPGRHHAAEHLRAQAGPDGQAAAHNLRHGYDVGPDPRVFTGEEPACPPGAGLYLVDDEQDIPCLLYTSRCV